MSECQTLEAWFASWARLNPHFAEQVRIILFGHPCGGACVRLPLVRGGQLRPEPAVQDSTVSKSEENWAVVARWLYSGVLFPPGGNPPEIECSPQHVVAELTAALKLSDAECGQLLSVLALTFPNRLVEVLDGRI